MAFATPFEVLLSNGERVPTRTIVSAVGTRPNPFFDTMELRGTSAGACAPTVPAGRGPENLWAGGDCAAVPIPPAAPRPPSRSTPTSTASHIGKNLRRSSSRASAAKPFRYPGLGQGVSIGRRTAVGELKGMPTGLFAWVIWRALLFYFFPRWDRRLRLIADWAIWPLVGRDIVQLGRECGEYEVRHHVYQPPPR